MGTEHVDGKRRQEMDLGGESSFLWGSAWGRGEGFLQEETCSVLYKRSEGRPSRMMLGSGLKESDRTQEWSMYD